MSTNEFDIRSIRLLLVEDNPADARVVERHLKDAGLNHVTSDWVQTASEAAQRLQTVEYDLVLLDLGLPDAQGLQALRALRAVAGPDMVVLRAPVTLWGENFKTAATFTVAAGETKPFVLSYGPSHLPPPEPVDCHSALDACEKFWRDWTATTKTDGPYADAVRRSLITLKALIYVPSGGIIAAPTTSLPEQPGGARNWDYRYCWIRDSTLTLLALMNAGVYDEATAWRDWLQRAVAGYPADMQIMYGLMANGG